MFFNATRPTSLGQLAALYTGNPNQTPDQVQADLGLQSSQITGYLSEQGRRLGIGDPATYFSNAIANARTAQAPILPEQLALRDQRANVALAAERADAANLASSTTAIRDRNNPLPLPGQMPILSPLETEDAGERGLSPMAYRLTRRLGGNAAPSNISLNSDVNATSLFHHPQFQDAMNRTPERASEVFRALTGNDLGQFATAQTAANAARVKLGTDVFNEGFQNGLFTHGTDGKVLQRTRVTDPVSGKLVLGPDYGPLDDYHRNLWTTQGVQDNTLGPEQAELETLQRKQAMENAAGEAVQADVREVASTTGLPAVFQSKKFASLQKANPKLANALFASWQAHQTKVANGSALGGPAQPIVPAPELAPLDYDRYGASGLPKNYDIYSR